MNVEQERIRGEEAKQLLSNPILKDAWTSVEQQILDQMKQVKPSDERMHTRLIDAYKILHTVRGHIERRIQTGKLAEFEIEQSKWKQRLKRFTRL